MTKIRIRHGENEIEIEGSDQFILKQIAEFYKKVASQPAAGRIGVISEGILKPEKKKKPIQHMTPAEYYKSKGKTDGISILLIFGKYLEEYEGVSEFSRKKINALIGKARLSKDLHAQYFTNAVKQGLLRSHGGGRYSLTLSAESLIAAM